MSLHPNQTLYSTKSTRLLKVFGKMRRRKTWAKWLDIVANFLLGLCLSGFLVCLIYHIWERVLQIG